MDQTFESNIRIIQGSISGWLYALSCIKYNSNGNHLVMICAITAECNDVDLSEDEKLVTTYT